MAMAPRENGVALDQFNEALRASPGWQDFLRRQGLNPAGPIRLSDGQRKALKVELERAGVAFPNGMEIDPAGNVNQDQGVSAVLGNKWVQIGLISGGALATMGALGFGPLAGVLGGGSAPTVAGTAAGTSAGVGAGTAAATGAATGGFWGSLGKFLGGPLGSTLVSTAGGLVATGLQASAANRASDAQADAIREALDFEKSVYEDDKAFFKPWGDLSPGLAARLSEITSERRPPVTAQGLYDEGRVTTVPQSRVSSAPSMPSISSLSRPRPVGSGQTPAAMAAPVLSQRPDGVSTTMPVQDGGRTVKMQITPTMVKDVPAEFVDRWKARGARVLEA